MVAISIRRAFAPLLLSVMLLSACGDVPVDPDTATVINRAERHDTVEIRVPVEVPVEIPVIRKSVRKGWVYYREAGPYGQGNQQRCDLAIDSYAVDVDLTGGKPKSLSFRLAARVPEPLWCRWIYACVKDLMLDASCGGSQELNNDPLANLPGLLLFNRLGSPPDAGGRIDAVCRLGSQSDRLLHVVIGGNFPGTGKTRIDSIKFEIVY